MNGFTNCPNSQDGSARRLSGFIPYLRLYYEHFGDNNNNLNNLIRVKYIVRLLRHSSNAFWLE